jgi:chemotaxis protein MotA
MTILGFILAFLLFTMAVFREGQDWFAFLNPQALAIVVGGSIAAGLVAYRWPEIRQVLSGMWVIFRMPVDEHAKYIALFTSWAEEIRVKGLSAIETDVEMLPPSFAKDGLELLLSGFRRDDIEEIMDSQIRNLIVREKIDASIFRTLALISPAFGLVGTLIGLIQMLRHMENVAGIAPAMSTAMTATFYGVVAANLVFLPVSVKLTRRTEMKVQFYRMVLDGLLMLADRRPPYFIEEKMRSYLAPGFRKAIPVLRDKMRSGT